MNQNVLNFMNSLDDEEEFRRDEEEFKNSIEYKQRSLDKAKNNARGVCLDMLFSKIYKDAVPLSSQYKVAYGDDLDCDFRDYIHTKCPKGMEYYVKERIGKSPVACHMLEAVNDLIDNYYYSEEMNPNMIDPDKLLFDVEDPDNIHQLDIISKDLSLPQVSDAITDNVVNSVKYEIQRAKEEKDKAQAIEQSLAEDLSIQTQESAIETFNLKMGYGANPKIYTPSLLSGIMIGNLSKEMAFVESGEEHKEYSYNALEPIGKVYTEADEFTYATPSELAMIESVKEITKLNILKALKLESYTPYQIREMSDDYAGIYTEGVLGISNNKQFNEIMSKIEKDNDFTSVEHDKAKKFLEKHKNDIAKASDIIKKEVKDYKTTDILFLIGFSISWIISIISMSMISAFIPFLLIMLGSIGLYIRVNKFQDSTNKLSKLRRQLDKIDTSKLSKQQQIDLEKAKEKIAETEDSYMSNNKYHRD